MILRVGPVLALNARTWEEKHLVFLINLFLCVFETQVTQEHMDKDSSCPFLLSVLLLEDKGNIDNYFFL